MSGALPRCVMSRSWGQVLLACIILCRASCNSQELIAASDRFPSTLVDRQGNILDGTSNQAWNQSVITGYYKGSWEKVSASAKAKSLPLLYRPAGALFMHITAVQSHTKGLLDIKGEAVLRDGDHYSEDDLLFQIRGVFVETNQRLHAMMESTAPGIRPELDPSDFEQQTPAYREALRGLYARWQQSAERAQGLPFQIMEIENPMIKRCEFLLDLSFSARTGSRHEAIEHASDVSTFHDTKKENLILTNGSMESQVCGLAISLNGTMTHPETYFSKATNYALMVISLTFLQTMLLLRQIECSNTQAQMSSVSLLTIGQQAIIDAYLCLLHLTTGMMVDSLFNAMATAAFFEFVIFAVFEMRYMLNIWKSRQGNLLDSRAQQRELLGLYARFYFALLCSIFISYQAQRYVKVLAFGVYGFWMPQIVSTAYQDTRQPLRAFYLFGISASRLMLPLYLYGCPHNILQMPHSPGFCIALSAFVALQVCILMGQQILGPRFFVPKQLLPPKYDYFRKGGLAKANIDAPKDIETGDAGVECVICMNAVDVEDARARMLTPCNHVFHTACLQRWMLVKMECPTCRTILPPE